jgi:hypothetical protein
VRTVSRRAALALGLAAAAGLAVPSTPARAAEITIGDLLLEVPEEVVPAAPSDSLGRNWQWRGRTDDSQLDPRGIVLARADLATSEPVEVLGLLLAGTAAGVLPDLLLSGRRSRVVDTGEQTRIGLSYATERGRRYAGELLIAARTEAPSGLVVVLGDGSLPTSFVSGVLGSVRWRT